MSDYKRQLKQSILDNKLLGILDYKIRNEEGESSNEKEKDKHSLFHMYNSSIKELTKEIPKDFFSSSLIEFNELMKVK